MASQRAARVARAFLNASSRKRRWATQRVVHGRAQRPQGAEFSNIKVTVMSRSRRSFDPVLLDALRSMPPAETLDRLGLHWKRDPDFKPIKNQSTMRLYVSVGSGVTELLATGPKWYDTRAQRGGGGAIDLTMHLFQLSFVDAVKLLTTSR
jgi:hypothetical protein